MAFDGLKAELKRLGGSAELKDYMNSHSGAYFVSAFLISDYDKLGDAKWTLEYYWPETGKVTTFKQEESWCVSKDDKVLQKEKRALEPLDVERVKSWDVLSLVREELDNRYRGESPMKAIVILNCHDDAPAWNITLFTKSFRLLNFKVDAVDGKLKSSAVDNLFKFDSKGLGDKA